RKPPLAFTVPVTKRFPTDPASVKDNSVFGVPLVSLIVSVPLAFPVPNVTIGALFVNARGEAPERVTVLLAAMVVAPEMAPAPVMPPLLLVIPPVIFAPPAPTVRPFWAVTSAEAVMVPRPPVVVRLPLVVAF